MGKAAEREMLRQHGTSLAVLKPSSIVHTAVSDLQARRRKADDPEADQAAHYAFHRSDVLKAETPADLLARALKNLERGRQSGKYNTRILYADEALLQQALAIAQSEAAA
jgi:hypothetical protein